MEPDMEQTAPDALPGCGISALALAGAAIPVAAGLTLLVGAAQVYPFVLLITLATVAAIGGPALLLIRARGRADWRTVSAGGFVTGALPPALLVLLAGRPDQASVGGVATVIDGAYTWAGWRENLTMVGVFGLAGIAGALAAWLLIAWLSARKRTATAGIAVLIAAGVAAMWILPWAAIDRSCHNPMRDGRRSIGPVASIELHAPRRDWRAVQAELARFARDQGWQVQAMVRTDSGFPWFQVSLCREPGTQLFVSYDTFQADTLGIAVYQPQGGDSWQAPLRALQDRLERRWPGSTRYDYGQFAPPRPPWAPPSPQPAKAKE